MAEPDRRPTVLVLEDDPDTRANLLDLLDLDGFRVVLCGSWAEALAKELDEAVDAVVLDRRLPDGTADERMAELEGLFPGVPKVVVTGYGDLDGAVAALRQGADDYLLKPVDPDLLRRSLKRLIELRRAQQRLRVLEREAEERRRLADIGAITSRVVHDLGNPVTGIGALAQMLLRALDDGAHRDRLRELASEIRDATQHMERMIHEFRLFSRGREPKREPLSVNRLLEELVRFYGPLAARHHLRLDLELGGGDLVVAADEGQMRRVLENLVKNAIEAAAGGAGRVVVVSGHRTEGGEVRISVRDDGPGVPDDFDPYRLFATTKENGTGLGLPICKQIVEQHGGVIHHEPAAPRGVVFHVDLPEHADRDERVG